MYTMVAERWMPELQYEQEKEGKHKRQFADRRNNMRRPITGDKAKANACHTYSNCSANTQT
jgi:hypothetical protein